ncbi:MAG: ribosome-associated translation inhibitor RaiA [Thermoanaerobacteraceae bacterium]|uniref:ribosome hibernation-promoting factor, HPF/YfiA family n=1 Tax=Thermanaeromonas sp. C210 TaxID=2731925 RepID=UPI00155CB1F9|nr:ribosome-associated translation inhibitor RaiA [Thermanaeromonas sp. C210]MBE3581811.1 ribosome-associated translation inhibitor RaiA [Thermoanaerobacteraceae bacterium]GFN22746.1 ribosomal subunit interface protein [Thermanaeromonas sp. C210]
MRIIVRGKNLQVTDALRRYAEKRLNKLEKFLGENVEVQVNMSVARDRHIVEVTAALDGYLLRGEEATGDMYSSIDLVLEKLEKQMEKYKTKLARRVKNNTFKEWAEANPAREEVHEADDEPKIVRTKRFPVKPMPVEEAILQMNLLGHNFFVFANAETEQVNVLYRRKDGNYGLIEPEL